MRSCKPVLALLAAALLTPPAAAQAGEDLSRAEVFRDGGWTGYLVYAGTPDRPVRCEVTRRTDEPGVAVSFIRVIDGRVSFRVALPPDRAKDLSVFTVFANGQPVRGPVSYDRNAAYAQKDLLAYDHGITQSTLDRFREVDEIAFPPQAVDLPKLSIKGAARAIERLGDCPSWRP